MVVKTKKWSPWQHPPSTASRKFRVKVKQIKLQGFEHGAGEKVIGVKFRWKGERKHGLAKVGFHRRRPEKCCCKEKIVTKGEAIVWEEEEELQNVCGFSIDSSNGDEFDEQHKFVPWILTFKFTFGDYNNKGKTAVIGKVSLDLAGIASKLESPVIGKSFPVDLQVAGVTTQATISVLLCYVEIQDPSQLVYNSTRFDRIETVIKGKKKQLSLSDSDDSVTFDSDVTSESSGLTESSDSGAVQPNPDKNVGFFDWKRRRLNFRPAKTKPDDIRPAGDPIPTRKTFSNSWESREFISRDGESNLKTHTFFASFDQRSDKAAGPSACTALVTVIAHWLGSNGSTAMPTVHEFDTLIINGSSEWRTLCQNQTHVTEFPDKHFDLETVLRAKIRPLLVSREKSFVGFFGPEKFESLNGVMSFDDIWDHEIIESRGVYIISWNDHFFVLKVDDDSYYIIDTLGERLVEGCDQAYILRFDAGSCLTNNRTGEVICGGKECCKEFIKRFLAAIPLKELEMEERKWTVDYYSLHQRLQIEFNFCSTA